MRVTEKGQVTIPKELRDALGIGAGTEVQFERKDDTIVVRKVDSPTRGRRLIGSDELGFDHVDRLAVDLQPGRSGGQHIALVQPPPGAPCDLSPDASCDLLAQMTPSSDLGTAPPRRIRRASTG